MALEDQLYPILNIRDEQLTLVHSESVPIKNNKKINLTGAFSEIQNQVVHGLYITRQHLDPAFEKCDINGNKLQNLKSFFNSRILLKSQMNQILSMNPLEHYGYDNDLHEPGHYAKIWLPRGMSPSSCEIIFTKPDAVIIGEVIEFNWVYLAGQCYSNDFCSNNKSPYPIR